MKKIVLFAFIVLICNSCQQPINEADITKINGYWEIEKVVFDQGKDKNYTINESYDYFEIAKNNKGFRKKVIPQLEGTFLVNDTQENVKVRFANDKVFLDYSTPYAKWTEELVAISDDKLVCKNAENKEYHYKKAIPINPTDNGKKTK